MNRFFSENLSNFCRAEYCSVIENMDIASCPFNNERSNIMTTSTIRTPKLGFSIRECVEATSLSRTTIYSHISSGRLRATRVGGRTIIPADSLRALIEGEAQADEQA
jgi:excisionase family DNA binding protein